MGRIIALIMKGGQSGILSQSIMLAQDNQFALALNNYPLACCRDIDSFESQLSAQRRGGFYREAVILRSMTGEMRVQSRVLYDKDIKAAGEKS